MSHSPAQGPPEERLFSLGNSRQRAARLRSSGTVCSPSLTRLVLLYGRLTSTLFTLDLHLLWRFLYLLKWILSFVDLECSFAVHTLKKKKKSTDDISDFSSRLHYYLRICRLVKMLVKFTFSCVACLHRFAVKTRTSHAKYWWSKFNSIMNSEAS